MTFHDSIGEKPQILIPILCIEQNNGSLYIKVRC